jgi:two-component system, chemotaxis family, chemotaxis protein CheY
LKKSWLIVDDSRVIRGIARGILRDLGFETDEAEDGKQALEACIKRMPDAVLLDWNMPVMNGIEFLRELRAMPGGTTPKVFFCTTENDMSHITQALETGADEFIMKPFDAEILSSKLALQGLA